MDLSRRFPAHVKDLREFLLKEKLPVPSPEAIPQLASRLETDSRFRADVGSLARAALYQERERIGYEDLLGILAVAAAGTEHDLNSDSQEADLREMLRFLLQSRRSTFHPEADEESLSARPGLREFAPEPALRPRAPQSAASSRKLELRPDEPAAVDETESCEPGDVVLPPFRSAVLFAAQAEHEAPRSRVHPVWMVGIVCMLVGVGLGMTIHRVVSAAETHVALRAARSWSATRIAGVISAIAPGESAAGKANAPTAWSGSPPTPQPATAQPLIRDVASGDHAASGVAAGITESPVGTAQSASATDAGQAVAGSQAGVQVRSAAWPVTPGKSSVPVTVVKQVVTASPGSDPGDPSAAEPALAATKTFVPQEAAGITAANVIFSPPPAYPAAAAAARVHGQVTVHAVVDPDGNVIYARAVSGPPLLRDAAEEAVQHWRYSPLLDNGKPIAATTVAILDFKMAK